MSASCVGTSGAGYRQASDCKVAAILGVLIVGALYPAVLGDRK